MLTNTTSSVGIQRKLGRDGAFAFLFRIGVDPFPSLSDRHEMRKTKLETRIGMPGSQHREIA